MFEFTWSDFARVDNFSGSSFLEKIDQLEM